MRAADDVTEDLRRRKDATEQGFGRSDGMTDHCFDKSHRRFW
jgi:hypothetical protein